MPRAEDAGQGPRGPRRVRRGEPRPEQGPIIDFDPDLASLCAEVKAKAAETSAKQREKERAAELEKKKKAAAERHRRAQEAQARSAPPPPSGGGMPGMPGGMGGVPPGMAGMAQGMMNDPDVMAAMSNPKVMAAFQEMMAGGAPNPAKMMQYMQDPDVGPVLQKMMGKFGGGMGGMPGMPGGMGGMGGMGGGGFDAGAPDIEEVGRIFRTSRSGTRSTRGGVCTHDRRRLRRSLRSRRLGGRPSRTSALPRTSSRCDAAWPERVGERVFDVDGMRAASSPRSSRCRWPPCDGHAPRHLHDRVQRIDARQRGRLHGHADDGQRRHRGDHARQVRGAARAGHYYFQASASGAPRVLDESIGRAVRAPDRALVLDFELLEHLAGCLHDRQVAVAAHDHAHEWRHG